MRSAKASGSRACSAIRRSTRWRAARSVQVLAEFGREESPVILLYPGGAHPPPKLRAFIDFAAPKLRVRLDEIARALA